MSSLKGQLSELEAVLHAEKGKAAQVGTQGEAGGTQNLPPLPPLPLLSRKMLRGLNPYQCNHLCVQNY